MCVICTLWNFEHPFREITAECGKKLAWNGNAVWMLTCSERTTATGQHTRQLNANRIMYTYKTIVFLLFSMCVNTLCCRRDNLIFKSFSHWWNSRFDCVDYLCMYVYSRLSNLHMYKNNYEFPWDELNYSNLSLSADFFNYQIGNGIPRSNSNEFLEECLKFILANLVWVFFDTWRG